MRFFAPLLRPIVFLIIAGIDWIEHAFARSASLYRLLLVPGFESFRYGIGIWRAWRNYYRAYAAVPAYKKFLLAHGGRPRIRLRALLPDLSVIPEMDKTSYIKKYSIPERTRGGTIPTAGVMVDESSGSSGAPTSWIRGPVERALTKQMLQLSYHGSIGDKNIFVINGFALGAWATGLNVSMSLTDISIMKSTGPNADKIINTLLEFGPSYHYLLTGYPPFLKSLVDDTRVDWKQYRIDAVYGGEGISESLRTHLLQYFTRVLGSYGASDLEINMAGETSLTIELRKAIIEDSSLREQLIRTEYGATPMIFQYNPLAYHIETNAVGELVVTLSRPYNLSPRIRYNIHDRGHVLRYPSLKKILRKAGRADLLKANRPFTDLPLLFLYGRSDMSIDYYGANVTPDSIREVLDGEPAIAHCYETFKLLSYEDAAHNKRMEIAVELREGAEPPANTSEISEGVFKKLASINSDFYNALYRTATPDNLPALTFHAQGTGPFEGSDKRLKNEYVSTSLSYDKL